MKYKTLGAFLLIAFITSIFTATANAQTAAAIPPILGLLIDDNEQAAPFSCSLSLVSTSDAGNAIIPFGREVSVTIAYKIRSKPENFSINITAAAVTPIDELTSSGIGFGGALGQEVASFNAGVMDFEGELTLVYPNNVKQARTFFQTLSANCVFRRIITEEENNIDFPPGTVVQSVGQAQVTSFERTVNWTISND